MTEDCILAILGQVCNRDSLPDHVLTSGLPQQRSRPLSGSRNSNGDVARVRIRLCEAAAG